MKRAIYIYVIFVCFHSLNGQQDPLLSQFTFVKENFNPSVITSYSENSLSLIHRNQWAGLPGAPETQLLSFASPVIHRNMGWGIQLQRNTIGIQERLDFSGLYAISIPIPKHRLSLGTKISGRRYTIDYTNPELVALNGIEADPELEFAKYNSLTYNFGVSVQFEFNGVYTGFFVDKILPSGLRSKENIFLNKEVRHYYFTAGTNIKLNEKWNYKPQVLFKFSENVPYNLDILNLFEYQNGLHLGLNIRSGGAQNAVLESFDYVMGFRITENIFAGLSYDITLSELSDVENGSLELLLKYNFKSKTDDVTINEDSISLIQLTEIKDNADSLMVMDTIMQKPDSILIPVLDEASLLNGQTLVFDKIYYEYNSAELDSTATQELKALASFMNKYPDTLIELIAHTDSRGSEDFNLRLSIRRAESAMLYLVKNGVDKNNIIVKGKGEQEIRNHCKDGVECSEEEHNYNRRTEVRIVK